MILKNKLDQIRINELTSAINEKNYKNSDYTRLIEDQKYIIDKLTVLRNRQAIQNNLQFDLIKFISYTENELMNNRNLKQEKEQLESKNEELNYQIMTINSELMKLKNQINSTKVENIVNNYFYEEDMDFAKYWDEDYYSINPNSCK